MPSKIFSILIKYCRDAKSCFWWVQDTNT